MKENFTLRVFRILSFIIVLAGAIVSLRFVLHGGKNNKSVLLVCLFVIWVLSPFIALFLANLVSTKWSVLVRIALYSIVLLITAGSLIVYAGVIPAGTKPAFKFLVIPLISWIFILVFIPAAISISRRILRRSDNVS
jgi:hypothetical protein